MPDASSLKVLVVEDEALVALDIENMLEEMGCKVVASVPRLVKALDLASRLDFDLAVLDINLAGEVVYPLAFRLAERGIPFLFSTGYSTSTLPPELRGRPIVKKPVIAANLKRAVAQARTDQERELDSLPGARHSSGASSLPSTPYEPALTAQ